MRRISPPRSPNRTLPVWDAVVELWFDSYAAMQDSWASPESRVATADLVSFCDLARSSWGLVDERGPEGGG